MHKHKEKAYKLYQFAITPRYEKVTITATCRTMYNCKGLSAHRGLVCTYLTASRCT